MVYQQFRRKVANIFTPTTQKLQSDSAGAADFPHHRHIRLISFNIQVGIATAAYRHYLTKSWQHVLPSQSRVKNLDRISSLLRQYDIVALQECDGGSVRSNYINQVEYLAEKSGHPFWYQQLNRNLGHFAQHSNGLLSRIRPLDVSQHSLPGFIPGRGAIMARFGLPDNPLVLVIMHLSLGLRAQIKQLAHVYELIKDYEHIVVMGDLNNHADQLLGNSPLGNLSLQPLPTALPTFPSWRPERTLDHIMVSPNLQIKNAGVVCFPMSDHLPIAVDIAMPDRYQTSRVG